MSSESKVFLEHPSVMTLTLFFLRVFVFIGLAKIGLFAQLVVLLRILVKQRAMKLLFILPLTFLVTSCFVPRSERIPSLTMATPIEVKMSEINEAQFLSDAAPIQIDTISVWEGVLTVKYSCAFNPGKLSLVGSPMLAKSFPPIRSCKFVIGEQLAGKKDKDKNGNFQGELHFDLSPLTHKFVKDAPTYLQIEGWSEKILYIYPYDGRTH